LRSPRVHFEQYRLKSTGLHSPASSKTHVRLVVPAIQLVDDSIFGCLPLSDWVADYAILNQRDQWPGIAQLEALRTGATRIDGVERPSFSAQSPGLLDDGLHYEERVRSGCVATREDNWHDLLNALVWLRYPRIKHALNAAQCRDIARIGRRQRTRAQCAMTHFDEAGAIVLCSDPSLLERWDRHDWHGLFWRERQAWDARIAVQVFGHAILELALLPQRLLVAKCIVLMCDEAALGRLLADRVSGRAAIDARVAELISEGGELADPQDLRPLPLSGIPGWHGQSKDEGFFTEAPCFRPARPGRRYPSANVLRNVMK
jgi:hypothetical protein